MAVEYHGFGTKLYGKRAFRADGSYLTTEWYVLLYLPIVPIRTLRIALAANGKGPVVLGTIGYRCLETRKPDRTQVASTYAFSMLWAAWLVLAFRTWDEIASLLQFAIVLAIGSLPWLVPYVLRRRARARVRVEKP